MKYRCVIINGYTYGADRYNVNIPCPFVRDSVPLAKRDNSYAFRFISHEGHVAAAMYFGEKERITEGRSIYHVLDSTQVCIRIIHYDEFVANGGYVERVKPGRLNSMRRYEKQDREPVEITFDELCPSIMNGDGNIRLINEAYIIVPVAGR